MGIRIAAGTGRPQPGNAQRLGARPADLAAVLRVWVLGLGGLEQHHTELLIVWVTTCMKQPI
jgi:hypothetical protein